MISPQSCATVNLRAGEETIIADYLEKTDTDRNDAFRNIENLYIIANDRGAGVEVLSFLLRLLTHDVEGKNKFKNALTLRTIRQLLNHDGSKTLRPAPFGNLYIVHQLRACVNSFLNQPASSQNDDIYTQRIRPQCERILKAIEQFVQDLPGQFGSGAP